MSRNQHNSARPDLDECECGDCRRDHENETGVCRLCRAFPTPWSMPQCNRFRFAMAARPEFIAQQEAIERWLGRMATS